MHSEWSEIFLLLLLQSLIYVTINNITKQVKKQQESEAGANNKTREITVGESSANKKKRIAMRFSQVGHLGLEPRTSRL